MKPIIYMEVTLNLMLHNGKDRVVENLVDSGEHRVKESKAGKYIILKQ